MTNSKRYNLIKNLILQYDRLHAQSEVARVHAIAHMGNFHEQVLICRRLQTRAEWVLQVANLLVDKLIEENSDKEIVQFT